MEGVRIDAISQIFDGVCKTEAVDVDAVGIWGAWRGASVGDYKWVDGQYECNVSNINPSDDKKFFQG